MSLRRATHCVTLQVCGGSRRRPLPGPHGRPNNDLSRLRWRRSALSQTRTVSSGAAGSLDESVSKPAATERHGGGSGVAASCREKLEAHGNFRKWPHFLSALASNLPGTIAQVSTVLAEEGVNIEALALGQTEVPELCRISIECELAPKKALRLQHRLRHLVCVAAFSIAPMHEHSKSPAKPFTAVGSTPIRDDSVRKNLGLATTQSSDDYAFRPVMQHDTHIHRGPHAAPAAMFSFAEPLHSLTPLPLGHRQAQAKSGTTRGSQSTPQSVPQVLHVPVQGQTPVQVVLVGARLKVQAQQMPALLVALDEHQTTVVEHEPLWGSPKGCGVSHELHGSERMGDPAAAATSTSCATLTTVPDTCTGASADPFASMVKGAYVDAHAGNLVASATTTTAAAAPGTSATTTTTTTSAIATNTASITTASDTTTTTAAAAAAAATATATATATAATTSITTTTTTSNSATAAASTATTTPCTRIPAACEAGTAISSAAVPSDDSADARASACWHLVSFFSVVERSSVAAFVAFLRGFAVLELHRSGSVRMGRDQMALEEMATQGYIRREARRTHPAVLPTPAKAASGGGQDGGTERGVGPRLQEPPARERVVADTHLLLQSTWGERQQQQQQARARAGASAGTGAGEGAAESPDTPAREVSASTAVARAEARGTPSCASCDPTPLCAPRTATAAAAAAAGSRMRTTAEMYRVRGQYVADRVQLHDRIASQLFCAFPSHLRRPEALLLMGVPGAGKSSIIPALLGTKLRYSSKGNYVNLDVDECLALLPEFYAPVLPAGLGCSQQEAHGWLPHAAAELHQALTAQALDAHGRYDQCRDEARFIIQKNREAAVMARRNLIIHSSGRSTESLLQIAQDLLAAGYDVHVCCLHVDTAVALARVQRRARIFGRAVPKAVIADAAQKVVRTFDKLNKNVPNAYLYDSTSRPPVAVFEKVEGEVSIKAPASPLLGVFGL